MILRFFKEFFNPKMKCDRVGHHFKPQVKRIRKRDSGSFWVVIDYRAKINICKRCGTHGEVIDCDFIDGYTGCTMPNYHWDEMREKGYTVME